MKPTPFLLLAATLAVHLPAQTPTYSVTAGTRPGGTVSSVLLGLPQQPFVSFLDLGSGPIRLLDETLWLGLTPSLSVFDLGVLDASGLRALNLGAPIGVPTGVPVYWQSLVFDAAAPNGAFRATDGESTIFYATRAAFVEDILDATAQGYTGDFDASVRGRISGQRVHTRLMTVTPPGVPFAAPIAGPHDVNGVRQQMVYRATDLGATGKVERLVGLRWKPFGTVTQDDLARLVIMATHSSVVPDFTVGTFSQLPLYPNSGLGLDFAANVKPGHTLVTIADAQPYRIRPANLRADGFLDYPLSTPFSYNGIDSLLLDFRCAPSPSATGANGQQIYLTVQTSPQPNARAYARGTSSAPLDPFTVTRGQQGDNSMAPMQFVFESGSVGTNEAVSPWRQSPVLQPDYGQPWIASSTPPGTSITVSFRGARSPTTTPTAWSASPDIADHLPFLQYRIQLTGNTQTGEVPSVDGLVIPIQ